MSQDRLRAVAYARSTADGVGASLDELRQLARLRAFCANRGFSLLATVLEQRDKSGQECRTKLDQLLAELLNEEVTYDFLLVDEGSRVSDDATIFLSYRNRLAAAGVKLVVANEHEVVREA